MSRLSGSQPRPCCLAGAPIAGQQVEQTHQPAGTTHHAAHQTQPLAGAEDDDDERDWEGLDERAVMGEGCYDEERKTAERCHDATFSEGEEIAFKLKVAEVVRKNPKARRIAVIPHPSAFVDLSLHKCALRHGVGVEFSLETLRHKDGNDRWFVPAMNFAAITCKHVCHIERAKSLAWLLPWRLEVD